VTSWK